MKITKLLLLMALAGSSLNQASAQSNYPAPIAPARHVGDGDGDGDVGSGDTNRYVAQISDNRPAAFKSQASLVSDNSQLDLSMLAPSVSEYGYGSDVSYRPSGCGAGSSPLIAGCGNNQSNWWVNTDALLWFGQKRNSPALITTSGQGVLPLAGAAGVNTQFGGRDGISSGLLPGYRLSGGTYIDSCQKIGVGGQVFGIFQSSRTQSVTSDGTTSIGVPFYNDLIAAEDAYLVAFNNGNPAYAGSASVRADLNMIGAEASTYLLLGRSQAHRVDLVTGYTFNRLKDSLELVTSSEDQLVGNGIQDGTIFTTNDLFATENVFHGGHIGMLSSVVHQRITLSTLAKVSLGNMRQSAAVRGSTNQALNGASQDFSGGILTQQSNITEFSRDAFAFIPQMNVKMGYALSNCLQMNVGYSFMYWSNVGLAGNQIDRTVDITQALGGPISNRPTFNFQESGFWMQGVDLGLTMTY